MIKCVYADSDSKSRRAIEAQLRKIKWLELVKTCASLDVALTTCKKHTVNVVFVRLHISPVPARKVSLMKKITKRKTKIVVLSNQIKIVRNAVTIGITNYVHLPTTSTGLWKAAMKALTLRDVNIEESNGQTIYIDDNIVSQAK